MAVTKQSDSDCWSERQHESAFADRLVDIRPPIQRTEFYAESLHQDTGTGAGQSVAKDCCSLSSGSNYELSRRQKSPQNYLLRNPLGSEDLWGAHQSISIT
jgi:hypothetical protein